MKSSSTLREFRRKTSFAITSALTALLVPILTSPVAMASAGSNGDPFSNGSFFPDSGTFQATIRGKNLSGVTVFSTSSDGPGNGQFTVFANGNTYIGNTNAAINGHNVAATLEASIPQSGEGEISSVINSQFGLIAREVTYGGTETTTNTSSTSTTTPDQVTTVAGGTTTTTNTNSTTTPDQVTTVTGGTTTNTQTTVTPDQVTSTTDQSTTVTGEQTVTTNTGQQINTTVTGEQTNTETTGAQTVTTSNTTGEQTTSNTTTTGPQTSNVQETIYGPGGSGNFDPVSGLPATGSVDEITNTGSQTVSSVTTTGSQTNTSTETTGAQTNTSTTGEQTVTTTTGAQTNTTTTGAQTNTTNSNQTQTISGGTTTITDTTTTPDQTTTVSGGTTTTTDTSSVTTPDQVTTVSGGTTTTTQTDSSETVTPDQVTETYGLINTVATSTFNDVLYASGSFNAKLYNSYPNQQFNGKGTMTFQEVDTSSGIPELVSTTVSIVIDGIRTSDEVEIYNPIQIETPYVLTTYAIETGAGA